MFRDLQKKEIMTKVHVHVYEIKAKGEFDCEVPEGTTDIEGTAMNLALAHAKEGKMEFGEPDNRFLAMAFVEE